MPTFSVKLDDAEVKRNFSHTLEAQVKAASATLNIMAALTRKNYIREAETSLTLRNTFTKRNIQFEKVQTRVLSKMQSSVGATERAGYMELQEEGGVRKPKRGNRLAIPQRAARGGSNRSTVRRERYIRKVGRQKIKGPFRAANQSKKSRLVAMAFMANKLGKSLKLNGNIYMVSSFNKSKNSPRFKLLHLYNVSQSQTTVRKNPMLMPSTRKPVADAQRIYNSQAKKLARKLK